MNKLILVTGPSGSGKTTLMQAVMENPQLQLVKVITITTRDMREGEIDGVDYYFVSKEVFETYIEQHELIEYNQYFNGHYYGITKEKLFEKLEAQDAFSIVEYNGMKRFKEYYPNCLSLFIYTDFEDMEKQLMERGGDLSDIKGRLQTYEEEMKDHIHYDVVIKNEYGKFDETVEKITNIILSQKQTP